MIGNWGRWGPRDESGALNFVGPEVTRDAVGLVRTGRTMSLAQPLGPGTPAPPHRPRPTRLMNRDAGDYALGARTPGGFRFAEDTVQFATHSGTHVDALAHAWSGETLYNGHPQAGTRSTRGATRCGADALTPVLTRGVLVDVAGGRGATLGAREAVGVDDLRRELERTGTSLQAGDAVLVRTGWWETKGAAPDYFTDEPGIDEAAARWLAEHDVSLVGADNYAVEQQVAEPGFPVHLALMHEFGVPLLENLVLDAQGTGEPTTLLDQLVRERRTLPAVEVFVGLSHSEVLRNPAAHELALVSFGAMGPLRSAAAAGRLAIIPCAFSDVPRLLDLRAPGRLVLLMQVSAPDEQGRHSLGPAVDYTYDLLSRARLVLAEVNDRVPVTNAPRLPASTIDATVHTSRPQPNVVDA